MGLAGGCDQKHQDLGDVPQSLLPHAATAELSGTLSRRPFFHPHAAIGNGSGSGGKNR